MNSKIYSTNLFLVFIHGNKCYSIYDTFTQLINKKLLPLFLLVRSIIPFNNDGKFQFGGLEALITGFCDEYPKVFGRKRELFVLALVIMYFLGSLSTITYVRTLNIVAAC